MNVVTSIGLQAASRTTLLKVITSNTIKALKVPACRPGHLLALTPARTRPGAWSVHPVSFVRANSLLPRLHARVCVRARPPVTDCVREGGRMSHGHAQSEGGGAQFHSDDAIQRQYYCEWQVCSGRRCHGLFYSYSGSLLLVILDLFYGGVILPSLTALCAIACGRLLARTDTTSMHTYIHTCTRSHTQTYIHTCKRRYMHRKYIHTYIYTYVYTYTDTHVRTGAYTHTPT
jgi:hypothetical protein